MSSETDKKKNLIEQGTLNRRAHLVKDQIFEDNPFFDKDDIVQVKYEMLRKVDKENAPVSSTSEQFGFSRPVFYEAKKKFDENGISGLVPSKRGRKTAHKMTDQILVFIEDQGDISAKKLAPLIKKKFGISVHPRTIERAVNRKKKST